MKRYTVTVVRERLAEALDEAEQGIPVVIERRGVRYTLAVERPKRKPGARASIIETVDPQIAAGQWTWQWAPGGLRLKGRR